MSSFKGYSNSESVKSALSLLDAELAEWATQCPPQFLYTAVNPKERSKEVLSDYYHVYPSMWMANIWNEYRCVRILVNELLIDQLNYLSQRSEASHLIKGNLHAYDSIIVASSSTLVQLAYDIFASVPTCLGYDSAIDTSLREPLKSVSGNILLWPLYTAAVTGIVSPMMRDWVAGRLVFISEVVGIKQASPLANSLMMDKDIMECQAEDVAPQKSKAALAVKILDSASCRSNHESPAIMGDDS